MQSVMTTNNGYDSILLVDSNGTVLSAWTATPDVIACYLRDGAVADGWETGVYSGFPELCESISDYGTECGRNDVIADEHRREFWTRPELPPIGGPY